MWTFGICTDGFNEERVLRVIESISKQRIPLYEIIVCGDFNPIVKNVTVIPFVDSSKYFLICSKKNLIIRNSKFDNICLMHDYVSLGDNWYNGFTEFGYDWDVCMTRITKIDGSRHFDWGMFNCGQHTYIDYDDYSFIRTTHMYVGGAYIIAKKNFLIKYQLNENLRWGDMEDVEWSNRVCQFWNYKMNKYSEAKLIKGGK